MKPKNYKVISISLYNEDLEQLDRLLARAKQRIPSANRSMIVRYALDDIDIKKMPKSYGKHKSVDR